ncbi:hypothetical protein BC941DRAFT_407602 [Chlamydoabsidia padenii]|nr:hypothetical protein BC941DRAFT_407602 [Chlamydoabsidia padenii]
MSFQSATTTTSVTTKLDDPDDLLLSYLNVDCLDTSNTPSSITENIINNDTNTTQSPPSSISSYEETFSPISSTYPSSWSSLPFLLNVNALANACISPSSDLVTGISPCSISRVDSLYSNSGMAPFISAGIAANDVATHLSGIMDYQHTTLHPSTNKSSSASPTISTVSSVSSVSSASSSDVEEPKRKRERKKQQHASSRRGGATLAHHHHHQQQPSSVIHACKPILPAQYNGTTKVSASSSYFEPSQVTNKQQWPSSTPVTIKPEPMDYSDSPILACLDDNSDMTEIKNQSTQQKYSGSDSVTKGANNHDSSNKTSVVDAHSKRQERLIKNRAAALLSRKRKREHLLALEHERQWLMKDNGLLKSKTATLEARIQQLEQENEEKKQQLSLLKQQQHNSYVSFNDDEDNYLHSNFIAMDPISKVTNVLMILFLSFALLTLPVSSNRSLVLSEDNEMGSFTSSSSSKNDPKSMYHTIISSNQQQQQHFTNIVMDNNSIDLPNDDPVYTQSTSTGQQEDHPGKKRKRSLL